MTVKLPASIADIDANNIAGKTVFVRVDFNVPVDDNGNITSEHRLVESLPTITRLLHMGAKKVLLASHFGRPKGQVNAKYSLNKVAEALAKHLQGINTAFIDDTNPETIKASVEASNAQVLLLENTRFSAEEEANGANLSKLYASLCDVYVNDAFGAAHRAHASTAGICDYVNEAYSGLLMAKELDYLYGVLDDPNRPLTAIIGGSKVSSKIQVITHLLSQVDALIIGGAMVFTFFKAMGLEVGKSLYEPDFVSTAKNVMDEAESSGKLLLLPKDIVVADAVQAGVKTSVVAANAIPADKMGLDVGPESIKDIQHQLLGSKTVLWNGPLGVFEIHEFAAGTIETAKTIADQTKLGQLTSVLGGGDTQAAVSVAGLTNADFSHVSTGGGASLELLEGQTLPGVAALNKVQHGLKV